MKIWTALLVCLLVVGLVFASGCIDGTTDDATPEDQSEQAQESEDIEDVTVPEFDDYDEDFGEII